MDDEDKSLFGFGQNWRNGGGGRDIGGGGTSNRYGHPQRNTEGNRLNNNVVRRNQQRGGNGATRGNHPRGLQEQQKSKRHSESDTQMDDNGNTNNERNQSGGAGAGAGAGGANSRRKGFPKQETSGNEPDNERQDNLPRSERNRNTRPLCFKALEEISQAEIKEIILKINERKESFLKVLQSSIENDKWDTYALLLKIIAKVAASSFDELKLKLLLETCNSKFIGNLRTYLTELPYAERNVRIRNKLYWEHQHEFWDHFITFCECIVNLSPSTALQKCRSLIQGVSKICLEELGYRHGFSLPDTQESKIKELRERLTLHEQEKEEKANKEKQIVEVEDGEPPDNFRQLGVLPTHEELVEREPFVRRNVVQGGYRDVEHYLDVQFRLLREDCFGPLREGISKFIENPNEHKYDHIRVYRNVKFIDSYINNGKIGSKVQLDQQTMKRFKRVNWAHSTRFIYGSLLLFTKDNCKSFITATILDRDPELIAQGKIPVSLVGTVDDDIYYNGDSYTMIESEVYFEPYYHVLKALQDPKFARHLAMQKYIVKVDPIPKPPAYMSPDAVFAVETQPSVKTKFRVLQDETWPCNEDINLNESQYEAYKLALTHEFAVIQGPPGTGKTYLGVKVAKSLLENLTPEHGACLMLVICYTNHALYQFLEAILPVTTSMVRIGGQSRSDEMKKINLNNLRKTAPMNFETKSMFLSQRYLLKNIISALQEAQGNLDVLNNGIVNYGDLKRYAPECEVVAQYYNRKGSNVQSDPLLYWLFENKKLGDFQKALDEYKVEEIEAVNDEDSDEDIFNRIEMIFDDFQSDGIATIGMRNLIHPSFSLKDTEDNLKLLISMYERMDNMNEQRFLQRRIVELYSRINHFNEMSTNRRRDPQTALNTYEDVSKIPMADRWAIYYKWADNVVTIFKRIIPPLQEEFESENKAYEEIRAMMDLQILKGVKVIGMTTSGAARLRNLLEMLSPPIVMVEEAAEVLEQHIVTSLTKNCEHLILIGDHQQLRPSAAYMKLARKYNLEVSLFERMITNGMHSRRLRVQHRMRPEIAALVAHIYPDLESHPSVEMFPRVRGMVNSMYFLTHNYKEEEVVDSSSRSNHMEAELALRLANYIMQQGCYAASDVTILAAYSGQMFYMRKQREMYSHLSKIKITVLDNYQGEESKIIILSLVRNNKNNQIGFLGTENRVCVALSRAREGTLIYFLNQQREMYSHLSEIKITVLDNYQGEESKIIILSLVRNNKNNQIGFLGTENRVCVALSRAREGFYMLGNIDILRRKSVIWDKIAGTLQNQAALGHALQLKCENHEDQITSVSSPNDFDKAPEGGCLLKCSYDLPCGHQCESLCHGYDRGHENYKCFKDCDRILCDNGHKCPYTCWQDCGDCKVKVEKDLPCGHKMMVQCYLDPADPRVKCDTVITATLLACKHEVEKMCHVDINQVKCPVPCVTRVEPCGHQCVRCCHVKDDPDHEKYLCQKPCARAKKGCTADLEGDRGLHQCRKLCYETCDDCTFQVDKKRSSCKHKMRVACCVDVNAEPCRQKCARAIPGCGHHCHKKCFETCGDCNQIVTKTLPDCHHEVKMKCKEEPIASLCTRACERLLSCGHRCKARCKQTCDPSSCTEIVAGNFQHFQAPCGRTVEQLPCNVYRTHGGGGQDSAEWREALLRHCNAPCGQELQCGHMCAGSCGACRQGRLHVTCVAPCGSPLVCTHRCNEPCSKECPPCMKRCEIRCKHSQCKKRCGETCVSCKEPCVRACPHSACVRRCGEACSRPPCDAPCPLRLACGHPCRGLCGETCPAACRLCRPDDFPKGLIGEDIEDHEKLVQLEDCPHMIEVDTLDTLMKIDEQNIKIPSCPWCLKAIINTPRYKHIVDKIFKEKLHGINAIKEKLYGNTGEIKVKKEALILKIAQLLEKYQYILEEIGCLYRAFTSIRTIVLSQKSVSLSKVTMQSQYLEILDMIMECYQKYKEAKITALRKELLDAIDAVCDVLIKNTIKISQQLQMDMGNEIKRMNSIVQLARIMSHSSYQASIKTTTGMESENRARDCVLTRGVFNETAAIAALKELQEAVKLSGIVSKQERDLIVKAIGMAAGSWCKCPNGHLYFIGGCGGAVQASHCDCGAPIGGTNYALLPGNTRAGRIDGV